MNSMVSRAWSFGCPPHPDGTPNLVCLCLNRRFKSTAKHGVSSVCPKHAQTGEARRWSIGLCTAGESCLLFSPSALLPTPAHLSLLTVTSNPPLRSSTNHHSHLLPAAAAEERASLEPTPTAAQTTT